MSKRAKKRWWTVVVDGCDTGVKCFCRTAGAAAHKAFKELIRSPKRPDAPLKNQPESDGEGGWNGVSITCGVAR